MQRNCNNFLKTKRAKVAEGLKEAPLDYKSRDSSNVKLQKRIQEFFEMDEHSRMCPGKKEFVRKGKLTKQKRFLTDTLRNFHSKFLTIFPDSKVSYSQFCKLRPFWVKFMKLADRDTCKSIIHENMKLLINALFKLDILAVKTCDDLINTVCCSKNESCLFRECTACKQNTVTYKPNNAETTGFYWKLMQKKESYFDKKTGTNKMCSKMTKSKVETSYEKMIQEF